MRCSRRAAPVARRMSYKNAMAGLPVGGGKGVILAGDGAQTGDQLRAFGEAIEIAWPGRYVTAEDVGMSGGRTWKPSPRPRAMSRAFRWRRGKAGGNPGPSTAKGVYLGIQGGGRRGARRAST